MVDVADELIINLKLYNGSAPKDKPERLFKDRKGLDQKFKPNEMLSRIKKVPGVAVSGENLFISGRTLLESKIAKGIAKTKLSLNLIDIFTDLNDTTSLFSELYNFYNDISHKSYKTDLEEKVEKMRKKINYVLERDKKYHGSDFDKRETILIENIKTILDIYLNKDTFYFYIPNISNPPGQEYIINSFEILPSTLTDKKDKVTITVALFLTKKITLKELRFDVTFAGDIKDHIYPYTYVSHREAIYFIDNYILKDTYITQLLAKLKEKNIKEGPKGDKKGDKKVDKAKGKKEIETAELIKAKQDIFLKPELLVKLLKIIAADSYATKGTTAQMIENNAKIISKIFFPLNTKLSIHGKPYIIEKFEFKKAAVLMGEVKKNQLFVANLTIDVYTGDKVLTGKELYKRNCIFKAKELDDIATELLPKKADGTSHNPIDFFISAYRVKGVKNLASKKKPYKTKLEKLEALQKAGRKSRKKK